VRALPAHLPREEVVHEPVTGYCACHRAAACFARLAGTPTSCSTSCRSAGDSGSRCRTRPLYARGLDRPSGINARSDRQLRPRRRPKGTKIHTGKTPVPVLDLGVGKSRRAGSGLCR
jgi:hypothetical protein